MSQIQYMHALEAGTEMRFAPHDTTRQAFARHTATLLLTVPADAEDTHVFRTKLAGALITPALHALL
jgi:hypothetical protein